MVKAGVHRQQKEFCESIKARFPSKFNGVRVVDIGSKNWNGDNRYLFTNSNYTGLDLHPGDAVDIVGPAHLAPIQRESCDVVISTEALEHDEDWRMTLAAGYHWLKPGGLMLITCATTGREEHATTKCPGHGKVVGDYYHNLGAKDFLQALPLCTQFKEFGFAFDLEHCDLYFYGIKLDKPPIGA